MRNIKDSLDVKGVVTVTPFIRNHKLNTVEYLKPHTKENLVVYRGRDFLAKRLSLSDVDADFFVNFVGVGRTNFPAPDLTQVNLYDQIVWHMIDSKTFSPTARGRVTYEASIEGNEFSSAETILEAGLFLSSYTVPGSVAQLLGTPYMFSRVTFPSPGFTVFPSTGSLSQGFLLTWSISF